MNGLYLKQSGFKGNILSEGKVLKLFCHRKSIVVLFKITLELALCVVCTYLLLKLGSIEFYYCIGHGSVRKDLMQWKGFKQK